MQTHTPKGQKANDASLHSTKMKADKATCNTVKNENKKNTTPSEQF
jgi:hypothetical protein